MSEEQSRPSILVIDDEPVLRYLLQEALQMRYSVHTAESGSSALSLWQTYGKVDLVLVDMVMPGISGLQFLERLSEIEKESVYIGMSGLQDPELPDKLRSVGAYHFLQKPFSVFDLFDTIDGCLQQKSYLAQKRIRH